MEYTFKIVEKKDNDLETVIEKGNLTTQFTLQDILDHLSFTNKSLRTAKAQLEAGEFQDKMAVELFPLLKEIPEDKWNLVNAYATRQIQKPISLSVIETAEKTIASYTEQLEYIKKELGLSTEVNEAPEEAEEEKVEEVIVD